jgi:spermidine synthase
LDHTRPYVEPVVVARAPAADGGELVLRARPGAAPGGRDVYELIVDGVFAMDTVQVSTELRLASETLARLTGSGWRVLVGGLGLGYTLRELLADQRVTSVDVVELESALVDWVRDGLVAPAQGLLDDPRATVIVADVVPHLLDQAPASYDAVLLDIDNGPDFLVHQANSALYAEGTLAAALQTLRPGGRLAIWSAGPAPQLLARLRALANTVEEVTQPVRREGRSFDYVLYLAAWA